MLLSLLEEGMNASMMVPLGLNDVNGDVKCDIVYALIL